jgi:hypothetical protein
MSMSCGNIDSAIPPLKALINLMCAGKYNGMELSSPQFKELFRRGNVVKSYWYLKRLKDKQSPHSNFSREIQNYHHHR